MGFGIAIGTSAQAAKLPKPAAGEAELTMRDITNLFGHEDVALLQRKCRHELPLVKALREMVLKAMSEM